MALKASNQHGVKISSSKLKRRPVSYLFQRKIIVARQMALDKIDEKIRETFQPQLSLKHKGETHG